MHSSPLQTIPIAIMLALSAAEPVRGDDQPPPPPRHYFVLHPHAEGTPSPGKKRHIPHTHERAGFPLAFKRHLQPSFTPATKGYYVGGGAAHGGEPPFWHEGTWGWDDTGFCWFSPHVRLGWYHGRKYQGGTGAYRTDGPVVRDPVAEFRGKLTKLHAKGDD
jgi:hypothetical protein